MNLHDVEKYQRLILPVLIRYSIKRAAIFGSLAKSGMNSNSDLDLLIEAEIGFTLFKMLKLQEELSEVTNRKVDLVEYSALKPSIRNEVLLSAIAIL